MLQQILDVFPDASGRISVGLALGVAGVGAAVGFFGARFSRGVITLAFVAMGTLIGLHMPAWFGWGIDRIGTAFGAAVLFGFAAYILPIFWERALLGVLLASFAGLAVWMTLAGDATWVWPRIDWTANAPEIGKQAWQSIPAVVNRALPIGVVSGFIFGALVGSLFPRLGRVLLYSFAGISTAVLCGAIGINQRWPEIMGSLPQNAVAQAFIFGGLILAAMGMNWLILPRRVMHKKPPRTSRSNNEEADNAAIAIQDSRQTVSPRLSRKPMTSRTALRSAPQ